MDGTVWLTQLEMADLFQTSVPNINIHIKSLFEEGELTAEATVKECLMVRSEGSRKVRREVKCYNLDMILAVGHQICSPYPVAFQCQATTKRNTLQERLNISCNPRGI